MHIPAFIQDHYEVHEWRHASTILTFNFQAEWANVVEVLTAFRLKRSDIMTAGGGKSPISAALDGGLTGLGWQEKKFHTQIVIDGAARESPTHKVDCFKNRVGLEIEWNNKDPFYDRDLNNFRLLFELGALDVGIIVTRSDELQDIFNQCGKGASYGASTTHMSKLIPRLDGGSGGGCPVLVIGITKSLYVED
ncbi:MAG: hypothetical protein JW395_3757 [Nitrospira sp.]|nr:hypothetical protein [Nitrospira sp.]